MTQSRLLFFVSVLLLGFGLNQHASGQAYPTKPVRLVVPFPAGGGSDAVGRVLAQKLSEVLGQQVFVDSRTGARGRRLAILLAAASTRCSRPCRPRWARSRAVS